MKNILSLIFNLNKEKQLWDNCVIARNLLDKEYIESKGKFHCECACSLCETCYLWFSNWTFKKGLVEFIYGEP